MHKYLGDTVYIYYPVQWLKLGDCLHNWKSGGGEAKEGSCSQMTLGVSISRVTGCMPEHLTSTVFQD